MAQRPAYTPASRHAHGGYNVRSTRYPVGAIRPNRNAAGMAYTSSRRGIVPSNPVVLTLSIRGTLDGLRGLWFLTSPVKCDCCGGQSKRRTLNANGQRRLALLRARREARMTQAA